LSSAKRRSIVSIVWEILHADERRKLVGIFILMLVGSALETVSLGLIVPAMGALTNPEYLQKFPTIDKFLGYPTPSQVVAITMGLLVAVYIAKSAFLVWSLWIQKGYSNAVSNRIGRHLFDVYLRQPYEFHTQRNSALLVRNSQNSASMLSGIIDPALGILADTLVTLGLFGLVMLLEPVGSLVTVVAFGLTAVAFRRFTNERIRRWGAAQNHHKGMMLKHLQQGFGGVKDLKVLAREGFFVDRYSDELEAKASVWRRYSLAQVLPRIGLENLTVLGLALLVSTMVFSGYESTRILPVIGLFGAAAFRLLPAVSRTISNLQTIKWNQEIAHELHADLLLPTEIEQIGKQEHSQFASINFSNVSFGYVGAANKSLDDVSLVIKQGEAVGLVGPSGSGKSTLVDVFLGLLAPQSGDVQVNGSPIREKLGLWRTTVGYVPQTIFLIDDSLRKNIAFGLPNEEINEADVQQALQLAQLQEFVDGLHDGLDTVVGERGVRLSGGQRQRIGIARALYNKPEVLVLDEATSSLDTETEHEVMKAVQALQGTKTVVIVAHRLSTVEYCDRLYRLENARVVDEGTFSEVMNRSREN
jgi:ABC-type multidrug transport system fused ATPase/permease subunit